MTAYGQSGVEFYEESYGAQDVTGFSWVQKFYIKNLEKVEKSWKKIIEKKSSFFVEKNIDFPKNLEFSDFKKHRFS